jgi:hypothetical protein
MSTQRQIRRNADGRSPVRRAAATRPSASGPHDRIVSARDIATYFHEDCRPLRDSLQVEMVAAQYHLRLREVQTSQGVPVGDAASAGVVAELEGYGDPLSHAVLRAFAHVATGEVAERAAEAAARLDERGVELPRKFADVADARVTGAWRATEGAARGEYALFLECEHSLGRRHSIAVFVEPRRGGALKHIGLMDSMGELRSDDPFHPSRLEVLDVADGATLLRDVLERTFEPQLTDTDDYRVLLAAARARTPSGRDGAPLGA